MKLLTTMLVLIGLGMVSQGRADDIPVSGHGDISLDSYECQRTGSSIMSLVCYQESTQKLVVLLSSTYYLYCDVPRSVVDGLLESSTEGRYFNENIKGKFDCKTR